MRIWSLRVNIGFIILLLFLQILLLIFQLVDKDYMKKKEYMEWNKKLITDISISKSTYKEQKFDENDSSKPIKFNFDLDKKDVYIWRGYEIYAYRRSFDYNYIKLRTLNDKEKEIEIKKCGKDFYGNYIYYPIYEKCPINFIEITSSSTPSLTGDYSFTTIQMDNSLYLHYTNEYTEGYPFYSLEISKNDDINDNILIDTYDESNFRTENTLIQKEQQTYVKLFAIPYGKGYEMVTDVNKKYNVFSYYLYVYYSLVLGIVAGFILFIIILIVLIIYCCRIIRHGKLGSILFYCYLLYILFYLPLFIIKIKLDYICKFKVIHYLHFIIAFLPIIIIVFEIYNIKNSSRYKIFWKSFFIFIGISSNSTVLL